MFHSLLIGIVTLGFGLIPKIVKPKKINDWYGYRTKLSMKNQHTWNEANKYYSSQFIIAGLILLIIGRIGYEFYPSKPIMPSLIALIPVLMVTVFTTEKHLKKNFDINGERKENNPAISEKNISSK